MIALKLPWPPTVNHSWGMAGNRKYLKKNVKEFRLKVSEMVAEHGVRIDGRLAIFIALYAPTNRKYDISNRIKQVEDALQLAGVFDDDEQVDVLWVERREVVKGGMCRVVIVPAEDAIETYKELKNG